MRPHAHPLSDMATCTNTRIRGYKDARMTVGNDASMHGSNDASVRGCMDGILHGWQRCTSTCPSASASAYAFTYAYFDAHTKRASIRICLCIRKRNVHIGIHAYMPTQRCLHTYKDEYMRAPRTGARTCARALHMRMHTHMYVYATEALRASHADTQKPINNTR